MDPPKDIAISPEDFYDFIREISSVFREEDAIWLLRLIGFDRRDVPDFRRENRVADWNAAFAAIDSGVLTTSTPYRDLLRRALRRFPGNAVLLRIQAADATTTRRPEMAPEDTPSSRSGPADVRRVHVMRASPRDRDRLRGDLKAIRAAAGPGHIDVTDSSDAGLLDLRAVLDPPRPDILHISGHGERGRLVFEDIYGEADAVPAGRVVELLATYRGAVGIRLSGIVLNSCDSAEIAAEFRPVADVVIAHNGPLDDECAAVFARELYSTLRTVPDLAAAAEVAATHCKDTCPQVATNLVCFKGTS